MLTYPVQPVLAKSFKHRAMLVVCVCTCACLGSGCPCEAIFFGFPSLNVTVLDTDGLGGLEDAELRAMAVVPNSDGRVTVTIGHPRADVDGLFVFSFTGIPVGDDLSASVPDDVELIVIREACEQRFNIPLNAESARFQLSDCGILNVTVVNPILVPPCEVTDTPSSDDAAP